MALSFDGYEGDTVPQNTILMFDRSQRPARVMVFVRIKGFIYRAKSYVSEQVAE